MWVPQRTAAVPLYLPSNSKDSFKDAAPGHKFLGYLRNTQGADGFEFAPYKGKAKIIGNPPAGQARRDANAQQKAEFDGVLNEVCEKFPSEVIAQITALRSRQQALINHYGSNGLRLSTTSTAPFATGLGNEHPIENGFAFLTPYGLPHLAGSGVKGILRRAAEELALENDTQSADGWTWVAIWSQFGFEGAVQKGSIWDGQSPLGQAFVRDLECTAAHPDMHKLIAALFATDKKAGARYLDAAQNGTLQFLQACLAGTSLRGGLQLRGALDFWDVFPQPAGNKLVVEIMTPHFGKYYQGDDTPHDSGAPVPVSFLAVPAKSQFDFHVVCQPNRLPEALQRQWRALLDRAFQHAFEWVGFGAKTSVGYGAMAATATQTATPSATEYVTTTSPTGASTATSAATSQIWPTAKLILNPGTGEITASFEGKSTAPLKNLQASEFRVALGDERANRLKKNKELKNISVEVEPLGNALTLKRLTTP